MERKDAIARIMEAVASIYSREEARIIAWEVAGHIGGFTRSQGIADPSAPIPDASEGALEEACRQLAAGRPLQYVVGQSEFYGLPFAVAEGVLIPRPETEELVLWIIRDNGRREGTRVLDIGTGSGAIAVALAHNLPRAVVDAVDVSPDALRIAADNAARNHVAVRFLAGDALQPTTEFVKGLLQVRYDVVVSNPPYIPASEYADMRDNVRRWEPAAALFVPDDDPLRFYRAIGRHALHVLAPGGRLYFEIHERFGREVCDLLQAEGFLQVECRKDLNNKARMVRCVR